VEDVLDADGNAEEGRPSRGIGPAGAERFLLPAQALEAPLLGQEGLEPGLALGEQGLEIVKTNQGIDDRRLSAASFTASTMCW
jgi:hypothetical protein